MVWIILEGDAKDGASACEESGGEVSLCDLEATGEAFCGFRIGGSDESGFSTAFEFDEREVSQS
ncbi:MAG: hypothetical protein IKS49_08495, partial [Actinomycetaceae bacterium]|nr:hypothetical protein [Actinomycetaceae bacterium]